MVNGIHFTGNTGAYLTQANQLRNQVSVDEFLALFKYGAGEAMSRQEEPFVTAMDFAFPAAISGFQGASWLWSNRRDYTTAMANVKAKGMAQTNIKSNGAIFKNQTMTEILNGVKNSTTNRNLSAEAINFYNQAQAKAAFAQAEFAKGTLSAAEKEAANLAAKEAKQLYAQAELAAHGAKKTGGNFISKGWRALTGTISKYTGMDWASKQLKTLATKNATVASGLRNFKAHGGPSWFVFDMAIESVTNVAPTFSQLGAEKGFKQLGKSAAKSGASAVGWVAGAAIGTKVGAMLGSIIPGPGTAIGAAAGALIGSVCTMVCGSIGMKYARKGAEAIVGKDELVKFNEEQKKETAKLATQDASSADQIVSSAYQRLEAAAQAGELSADDLKAKEIIEKYSFVRQAQLEQEAAAQQAAQQQTQVPYAPQQSTYNPWAGYNPYVLASNPYLQQNIQDLMNKDIMAYSAGLI